MRRKLIVLAFALMGVTAALCIQPRRAEASTCFCADPLCCNYCCAISPGKYICTERACY